MVWTIAGLALSVFALALTLFLEWPRLLSRLAETRTALVRVVEAVLMAVGATPILIVAWHFLALGGIANMVRVSGWVILTLLFSTLCGAAIVLGDGVPRSNPLRTTAAGLTLLLGPPIVGVANLLLSPNVFFPHPGYVLAALATSLPFVADLFTDGTSAAGANRKTG
ncbi:MAG: hypothetical protein ABI779_18415 [Acidobacteriota bacterium]